MGVKTADLGSLLVHDVAEVVLRSAHIHCESKARIVCRFKNCGIDKIFYGDLFAFLKA